MRLEDLYIVFVGDAGRGRLLEKAVKNFGWNVSIVTKLMRTLAEFVFYIPDLVILDDFPDSEMARSVYFHLRSIDARPILALNHSPNAFEFMHLNSLSFLKLIDYDSDPDAIIQTINDMVSSHRRELARKHSR